MAPDALLDELATRLGSRRDARWVLAELDDLDVEARAAAARAIAARREAGEPLQYVLGHWPFRTLDLAVDGRALIPRPETEAMVDLAVAALGAAGRHAVCCDLGCGTGAIGLSVAVEADGLGCDVEVHLVDVSDAALELAASNAARVGAAAVELHRGSWFDALPHSMRGRIDVACANPPYVAFCERDALARELHFEPELALFAADGTDGTAGFADVEAVITAATRWLTAGGTLLVEHGDRQGDAAVLAARGAGLVDVVDHADLAGHPRLLSARRPT